MFQVPFVFFASSISLIFKIKLLKCLFYRNYKWNSVLNRHHIAQNICNRITQLSLLVPMWPYFKIKSKENPEIVWHERCSNQSPARLVRALRPCRRSNSRQAPLAAGSAADCVRVFSPYDKLHYILATGNYGHFQVQT